METNIDRTKMAEVSKIITEKQDDQLNGERPGQDAKNPEKTIITYRRISKRLAVETTSLLLCSIIPSHHYSKVSMPSLSFALRCMLIT